MADETLDQSPPAQPVVIRQGRGCFATLVGSALVIVVSALAGAALAIMFMWYGPRNVGMTFPDSTGRLEALEVDQRTAVVERADMQATLRGLGDLRESVNALSESVQTLESSANTRETDLDTLQNQITANVDSLLAIQQRLDELESVPANASLANRIAEAELQLATVSATLDRLRLAFGVAVPPPTSESPAATAAPPAATPTP
ncbi:MAG TPA: hypothetical protein VD886_05635 [Herpetosiphonaceae bacterium]|nr:hypothetical protein [Herpetosiphonaceae bacterium]